MYKLILIWIVILTSSINAESSLSLFLKKPKYENIKIHGIKYKAFDKYNCDILVAKHSVLTNLFLPSTNCIYSNLIINNEILEGNLFLAETKLQQKALSDKIKSYGLVGLGAYAVITTLIILAK
jgi:hypothetical protein